MRASFPVGLVAKGLNRRKTEPKLISYDSPPFVTKPIKSFVEVAQQRKSLFLTSAKNARPYFTHDSGGLNARLLTQCYAIRRKFPWKINVIWSRLNIRFGFTLALTQPRAKRVLMWSIYFFHILPGGAMSR